VIATFVAAVFAYSLVSRRLERTVLTAPILFTAAGALLAFSTNALNAAELDRHGLLLVAELGLVMLLFTDASRVSLRLLKDRPNLPGRLLSAGMLLTIALGALCAMVVLGHLSSLRPTRASGR
jgi:NhaP-type Na+/H+ or K+/H+ antiporter